MSNENNLSGRPPVIRKPLLLGSAVLSVIVGLLPNLIPGVITTWLHSALGKYDIIVWVSVFFTAAGLAVFFSYRSGIEQPGASGNSVAVKGVRSGKSVRLKTHSVSEVSAQKIHAGDNIHVDIVDVERVNLNGLSSDKDTNITVTN